MKYIIKLITFTAVLCNISCYGMITAAITQEIITTSTITRSPLHIVIDAQTYTTGGITFTYPVGLFTLPPFVQVSVQSPSHPMDQAYTVEIENHSASSTTVMVSLVQTVGPAVVVNEAPNLSVTVYLLAIEQPV
jgi:hypothetical protein